MEGKPPEEKKKGLIGKLKDVAEDKEHQIDTDFYLEKKNELFYNTPYILSLIHI